MDADQLVEGQDTEDTATDAPVVPGSDADLVAQANGAPPALAQSQLPDGPVLTPPPPTAGRAVKKPGDEDEDLMPEAFAQDMLEFMLSASAPPPLPQANFFINRPGGERWRIRIRGVNESEVEEIEERCFRDATPMEKKRGASDMVRDMARIKRLTAVAGIVEPQLTHPALLEKYGPTSEHVARRWFLAGELDKIVDAINDLSGYKEDALEKAGK